MPNEFNNPGVRAEGLPGSSGVHLITGAPTSITVFIGRTFRGPANEPILINSFTEFQRVFGGLWSESTLGYAVRDFFFNGGEQAAIVRLYHPETGDTPRPSKAKFTVGHVTLEAAYEGSWGNNLHLIIDYNVSTETAVSMHTLKEDLFNLTVEDMNPGGITERFVHLSLNEGSRRIDRVLQHESTLMRWSGALPPLPFTAREAFSRGALSVEHDQNYVTARDHETWKASINGTIEAARIIRASDGLPLTLDDFIPRAVSETRGLYALERLDIFNILCIPPYTSPPPGRDVEPVLIDAAAQYCEQRRAMLIISAPSTWTSAKKAQDELAALDCGSKNAAIYFPQITQADPLRANRIGEFAPCGAVAGIIARTDAQRCVWSVPAGAEATLRGVSGLNVSLTDAENRKLNSLGINCLRSFPAIGPVVWGARTLQGADAVASEWKFIPVRRTALYIEESLRRGLRWVAFEPNGAPLWTKISLSVGAFLHGLFEQGAFEGKTPAEAYFVKCDSETTTEEDINKGDVNLVIGFAPQQTAKFIILRLQLKSGQT